MDIKKLKTEHSFNGELGALKPTVDLRDYKISFGVDKTNTKIPKVFEGTPPVKIKDQHPVSSCVAHGISEVMEHLNLLETGKYTELSTGFIYGNKKDKNSTGMIIRDALKFVNKTGDVLQTDFPYNLEIPEIFGKLNNCNTTLLNKKASKNKIITYFQLNSDDDIKQAIMKYGYVVFGIKWYSDNQLDYEIFSDTPYDYSATLKKGTDHTGYHCVICYGWDENNWKIINSWGFNWGCKGCAYMPFDYGVLEAWGVKGNKLESEKVAPIAPKPVPTPEPKIIKPCKNPLYQIIAKFINWIINLFKKEK